VKEIQEIGTSRDAFADLRPDGDLALQQPKGRRSQTLLRCGSPAIPGSSAR
jgi:hypothetical protein